jgi:hypothetical protein
LVFGKLADFFLDAAAFGLPCLDCRFVVFQDRLCRFRLGFLIVANRLGKKPVTG